MPKDSRTLYQFVAALRDTADPNTTIPLKMLFDIYDEESRGSSPGRPRAKIEPEELQKVIRLNEESRLTNAAAAKSLGVSERTYYRIKRRADEPNVGTE